MGVTHSKNISDRLQREQEDISMMESHSSIRGKGRTKVSVAAVPQRGDTGCCLRCSSNYAGIACDMRKTNRMKWPEGCNRNGGRGGTNGPTTNQVVASDQQRPKQPKYLAPDHHTPMAAE